MNTAETLKNNADGHTGSYLLQNEYRTNSGVPAHLHARPPARLDFATQRSAAQRLSDTATLRVLLVPCLRYASACAFRSTHDRTHAHMHTRGGEATIEYRDRRRHSSVACPCCDRRLSEMSQEKESKCDGQPKVRVGDEEEDMAHVDAKDDQPTRWLKWFAAICFSVALVANTSLKTPAAIVATMDDMRLAAVKKVSVTVADGGPNGVETKHEDEDESEKERLDEEARAAHMFGRSRFFEAVERRRLPGFIKPDVDVRVRLCCTPLPPPTPPPSPPPRLAVLVRIVPVLTDLIAQGFARSVSVLTTAPPPPPPPPPPPRSTTRPTTRGLKVPVLSELTAQGVAQWVSVLTTAALVLLLVAILACPGHRSEDNVEDQELQHGKPQV